MDTSPPSGSFDRREVIRPRVLLIDDCEDSVEMYAYYLAHEGFDVVTASDAKTGLDRARKERPRAIVIDARLPDIDGIEALRVLKGDPTTWNVPVIVLTVMSERRGEAIDVGASSFVLKPCLPSRLVTEIRNVLMLATAGGRLQLRSVRSA